MSSEVNTALLQLTSDMRACTGQRCETARETDTFTQRVRRWDSDTALPLHSLPVEVSHAVLHWQAPSRPHTVWCGTVSLSHSLAVYRRVALYLEHSGDWSEALGDVAIYFWNG